MTEQETMEVLFAQDGGPRFELIPTKRIVQQAKENLPAETTLTITCSPTHGIDQTIDTTIELAPHFDKVVPHIAARMVESEEYLDAVLEKLYDHKIADIFIVGGDQKEPLGPYENGLAVVKYVSEHEHRPRRIGVPAYPEGHPNVDDKTLARDLLEKTPFAQYAVTQMCFDTDQVLAWLQEQRESGVEIPIYLGIPGPVRPDKLLRIAPKIGVMDSLRFLRSNLKLSGKLLRGYDPGELIEAYTPHFNDSTYDISGFHTYTFNELSKFKKISS